MVWVIQSSVSSRGERFCPLVSLPDWLWSLQAFEPGYWVFLWSKLAGVWCLP